MNYAVTNSLPVSLPIEATAASYNSPQLSHLRLTPKELGNCRSTSFKDVQNTLATIQAQQETQRAMMNLTRIQPFFSAMLAYTELVRVFPDASSCLAVIWGSLKFMLLTSKSVPKAFDNLLEAYEQLGDAIPSLNQSQTVFDVHPQLKKILELMYSDLLEFHERGIQIFDRPNWRQLFSACWKDLMPRFNAILKNLSRQKQLIESFARQTDNHMEFTPVQTTFNLQYIAGNFFKHIDVTNSQAHIGDSYSGSCASHESTRNYSSQILEQLTNLERSSNDARSLLEQQELARHEDQFARVRDWIAGPRVAVYHDKAYQIHLEYKNTGLWILKDNELQCWMNGDLPRRSILWMHGIPGAGKTILASVIIEACMQVEDSSTIYFYCQYDNPETCKAISILNGLLSQAIIRRRDLIPYFDEQRQQSGGPMLELEKVARRLIETICLGSRRNYIVIDGLDECTLDDRSSILSFFNNLIQDLDKREPGKNRLLIISHNEPDIKKALVNAQELELKWEKNRSDIEHFVTYWARKIRSKFELDDEQEDHIKTKTCLQAAGQFLYAELVVKNLCEQPTLFDLQNEIEDSRFPQKLSEAYERIIYRIRRNTGEKEWNLTKRLLGWMTCAARPLRWHEMQGAVSIGVDKDEEVVNFDNDRRLRKHVQDTCGALVTVLDDRICLVHSTARRFIAESEYIDGPNVECEMASLCMQYLSFDCFGVNKLEGDLRYFILNGYFAFADYAVAKWMHHVHRFINLAKTLSAEDRWNDREIAIQELCDAAQFFTLEYADDLQASQAATGAANPKPQLSPQARGLLSNFEDAEQCFELLWMHLESYRHRDASARNMISLERLRQAMEQIRTALENMVMATDTFVSASDQVNLKMYYGTKAFRCSKLTCFYFHEGFTDKKTRDKHVAKHDRPWQCSKPDCKSADFGFDSKQTLENHMLSFHPDIEMKAKLFKTVAPKPPVTKWSCSKCGRSFARNGILKDHQLVHTGQKPHECSRCGKAFTRKNDCTRHERTHENRRS